TILSIYSFLLFARLLLSWFPNPPEWARPVYGFLFAITDPLLRLVRPLVPPLRMGMMALDLSPIIIFIVITIVIRILDAQGVC
ncbi:MAG: YggT family protein, partial [Actinomycetota bacterium]